MVDPTPTAAELLRHARAAAGWSQRDLATAAKVPPSTVGRIESGARQPSYPLLVRLLRAAGFEPHIDLRHIAPRVPLLPNRDAESAAEVAQRRGPNIPVEVPADLTRLRGPRRGVVHLPASLYASGLGVRRAFDLADEAQRIELYETVLAQGSAAQIEEFLNLNELLRLWPRLWLPPHVRTAWRAAIPFATRASA